MNLRRTPNLGGHRDKDSLVRRDIPSEGEALRRETRELRRKRLDGNKRDKILGAIEIGRRKRIRREI